MCDIQYLTGTGGFFGIVRWYCGQNTGGDYEQPHDDDRRPGSGIFIPCPARKQHSYTPNGSAEDILIALYRNVVSVDYKSFLSLRDDGYDDHNNAIPWQDVRE